MIEMFELLGCFADMVGYKPTVDGFPKVRFRNGVSSEEFFLINEDKMDGPIATKEQYENSECSFAHLQSDGKIMRFREQIGTIDDLFIWYPLQLHDSNA